VDAPPTFWPVVDAAVDAADVVSDDEDDPHPTRRAAEQMVTAAMAPMRGIFMWRTLSPGPARVVR
jgi:hypothetical protein